MVDLRVTLGRLALNNPVLVASGTFGYVREMKGFVRLERLGGVIPKTVTFHAPRRQPDPAHGRDGLGTAQRDRPGQRRDRPLSRASPCPISARWARR